MSMLPMMSMMEYGVEEVLMLLNVMARCEWGGLAVGHPKVSL